jgi:hypothetical protein
VQRRSHFGEICTAIARAGSGLPSFAIVMLHVRWMMAHDSRSRLTIAFSAELNHLPVDIAAN